jgi:adenosylmethionine-8-amino-7-oxononanoate aminotransferase
MSLTGTVTREEDLGHTFVPNWAAPHLVLDHGEGVYVYDVGGKRYLDGLGGIHVVSIGYGVRKVADAMAAQAAKIPFAYGSQFVTRPRLELAERVIALAPPGMARAYFVSGGSEANEVALAMARQYHLARGKPSKQRIIGRWHSFHGLTMATLAMSGHVARRADYQPYLLNFPHVAPPYSLRCPDCRAGRSCAIHGAAALERAIELEGAENVAAFIAEPIVGTTSGALTPPPGYYEQIRAICDKNDILFIADEVITGFGRTGLNFGIQHWDAVPDLITSAKGLSSGYAPIGAVLLRENVWEAFAASNRGGFVIGHTFSGHPVSCAAALAVLDYLEEHQLIERSATMGALLKRKLEVLATRCPFIGEVRGKGLLLGLELVRDRTTLEPFDRAERVQERVVEAALARGLILVGSAGFAEHGQGDHVIVSPPFVITESQCDELVAILEASLAAVLPSA